MQHNAELIIATDNWQPQVFTDRDGKQYVVEGSCDTSRCNAVCCRVANWRGRIGRGPCEFLMDDNKCHFHAEGGPACKPVACWYWPLRQVDVDGVNAVAERLGLEHRCHLRVVEWQS